jgi:hypothetical protein
MSLITITLAIDNSNRCCEVIPFLWRCDGGRTEERHCEAIGSIFYKIRWRLLSINITYMMAAILAMMAWALLAAT